MSAGLGFVIRTTGAAFDRAGVIINEHTLSAEQVRFHIEVLSRSFDFIHHDDLLPRIERPRKRPFCLLTFDDGKRSNANEVAPELERLGVPAVFYLVTGFLDQGGPLWFDRRIALRRALGHYPRGLEPEVLKQLPLKMINERLDDSAAIHEVDADPTDDDVGPMTCEQARSLSARGFTLGAHTLDHPVLIAETGEEARRQVERSIRRIEELTGGSCATFAFPNGNYTASLAKLAIACGVQTAMTTEPLWVDHHFPPWRLPRIQLFPRQSRAKLGLKLALAAQGRLLHDPNGTGSVYRKIQRRARETK